MSYHGVGRLSGLGADSWIGWFAEAAGSGTRKSEQVAEAAETAPQRTKEAAAQEYQKAKSEWEQGFQKGYTGANEAEIRAMVARDTAQLERMMQDAIAQEQTASESGGGVTYKPTVVPPRTSRPSTPTRSAPVAPPAPPAPAASLGPSTSRADNTWLYVGAGVAVFGAAVFIWRARSRKR